MCVCDTNKQCNGRPVDSTFENITFISEFQTKITSYWFVQLIAQFLNGNSQLFEFNALPLFPLLQLKLDQNLAGYFNFSIQQQQN